MGVKIEYFGTTEKELLEALTSAKETIEMRNFTLIMSGVIKRGSTNSRLTPPFISIVSQTPEEVVVNIQRTDDRGTSILWEIGADQSLSQDVVGLNVRSGVISDSSNVTFSSNGDPINSFYIRAIDRNPSFESGESSVVFVSVDDKIPLLNPEPILTPLDGELKLEFFEDPEADSFLVQMLVLGNYVDVETNASSPYTIVGLTNDQAYTIRVTAVSENNIFESTFTEAIGTPLATPVLSTPTDIVFNDLGSGDLELVVSSSETGVSYVVERDLIEIYSGVSPTSAGNAQGTTYSFRVKLQKAGFTDSDWYTESYTYQPYFGETIESYGGQDFYKPFFGSLTYEPLGGGTSKVTYQGVEDVFNASFVDKWLEPSRIHHTDLAYPSGQVNYFPNSIAVVYSKVLSVIDGKNLIVDFEYNGKNRDAPVLIAGEDGTFFFDNKPSIEAWGANKNRKDLIGQPGVIYATLGMPNIICAIDSDYNFVTDSINPSVLHCMASDAFTVDANGTGTSLCPSYVNVFRSEMVMFDLPGSGHTNIDFQWQPVGPTYTPAVVQYGTPAFRMFEDKNGTSQNYGMKRVVSKNPFIIQELMASSLGYVRSGANYVMPSQGGCNSGGLHNGVDIVQFSTYRFEGSWITKNTADFKGRQSGGVLLEWEGVDERGSFINMDELAATEFDISCKWNNNRDIKTNSNDFTWYKATGQYWTGGVSTIKNPNDKIVIDGSDVWFGNNGDWWLLGEQVAISSDTVKSFNRILSVGNIIKNSVDDAQNGLIKKLSNTEFVVWGWAIQVGDILTHSAVNYTVTQVSKVSYTWNEYSNSYPNTDRFINAFKIVLDKPIVDALASVEFTVNTSKLGYLLDGNYRACQYKYDAIPFTNLLYIDSNLNTRFTNVNVYGNIRATSPTIADGSPLWNYSSIAEWTDVFLINRDGSPSYRTRNEYQPSFLRIRQLITLNNDYRFKISGGRVGVLRNTLSQAEYEFSNKPHLVRNDVQGERFVLYNPIISDGLGLILGIDDVDFSRAQIGLSEGFSVDLSNSEMRNNLEIFGDGTVDISGITTNLRRGSSTLYYSIEIWDDFSVIKDIGITGDGGAVGIAVMKKLNIGEIAINLTTWELKSGFNNPTGFTTLQNTLDPNYCDFISINAQCVIN